MQHLPCGELVTCGIWLKVSTVTAGSVTLGVAVGPRQYIAEHLLGKAYVVGAMNERVQLCQDPQTECALLRESLGESRINHILRVHGHTILQEQRAAEICDVVGQRSLERFFPGLREDSTTQATLGADSSQASEEHTPLKRCVLTPHDYITNVQKGLGNRL